MEQTERAQELEAVAELFRALASPVRIAIIDELAEGERRVGQLSELLNHSQPLISQHLRVLRSAGLVERYRSTGELHYALADEHVRHIVRDALIHIAEGSD